MLRLLRLQKFKIVRDFCHHRDLTTLQGVFNPLPATFLRGGTSKGVFLNRAHLPTSVSEWKPIILGIMGSPDPEFGRQRKPDPFLPPSSHPSDKHFLHW
jgi:hypothetical protein